MGNRGLSLAGVNVVETMISPLTGNNESLAASSNSTKAILKDGIQVVNITADGNGYTPNVMYVKKDVPVKWIIDGKQINSCNNAIVVPALNIKKQLDNGENIIEFTPKDKGINFSCWMGMITGVIRVVDNLDSVDTSKPDPSAPPTGGGNCCSSMSGSNSTNEQ